MPKLIMISVTFSLNRENIQVAPSGKQAFVMENEHETKISIYNNKMYSPQKCNSYIYSLNFRTSNKLNTFATYVKNNTTNILANLLTNILTEMVDNVVTNMLTDILVNIIVMFKGS